MDIHRRFGTGIIDHQHIAIRQRFRVGQTEGPDRETQSARLVRVVFCRGLVRIQHHLAIGIESIVDGRSQAGAYGLRVKAIYPGQDGAAVRQDGRVGCLIGDAEIFRL